METDLFIRARNVDSELVEKAAEKAKAEFEKTSGFAVHTEIDTDNPLDNET